MNTEKKAPLWYFLPILLLALFLGKPFHIDDTLFINIGRILPWTVLGSNSGNISFLGKIYEGLSPYESTHPPLIPYFLKLISAMSGREIAPFWLYHLFFLIFPFLTLKEGWNLSQARRMTPVWAWFLVLSPLFFVNATNLMTDVAMLCFWLGSVTSIVLFVEKRENRFGIKAVLYLLAAFFTSYQSLSLIPLLILFILVNGSHKRKSLLVLLIPTLVFTGYLLIVYSISGFFPFIASTIDYNIGSEVLSGMKLTHYLHKFIGVLVFTGLGLAFPTPLLMASLNRRRFLEYVVFASIISFTFFHLGQSYQMFDGYTLSETWFVRFLMLIGGIWLFFMLAKLIDGLRILTRSPRRSAYRLLFSFWFFGVLAFNILFLPYSTARYLLPAIPAAIVLLFIRTRLKAPDIFVNSLISLLACLSLLMASVDFRQASSDWTLFQRMKEKVGDLSQLWYSDDAGLALYLGTSGANYITEDLECLPEGSYVLLTRGLISEKLQETLDPIETFHFRGLADLSLFNTSAHAGFYRSYDGFLPIAFTTEVRRAVLFKSNFFLRHFDRVQKIRVTAENYADVRAFYLPGEQLVRGIHMHPDAEISFPLELSENTRFSGDVLVPPMSWDNEGDGTLFKIGVRRKGTVDWIWELWLDPKSRFEDRGRKSFSLPLSSDVEAVHLKVEPGPAGDYRNDSVFWLSLEMNPPAGLRAVPEEKKDPADSGKVQP